MSTNSDKLTVPTLKTLAELCINSCCQDRHNLKKMNHNSVCWESESILSEPIPCNEICHSADGSFNKMNPSQNTQLLSDDFKSTDCIEKTFDNSDCTTESEFIGISGNTAKLEQEIVYSNQSDNRNICRYDSQNNTESDITKVSDHIACSLRVSSSNKYKSEHNMICDRKDDEDSQHKMMFTSNKCHEISFLDNEDNILEPTEGKAKYCTGIECTCIMQGAIRVGNFNEQNADDFPHKNEQNTDNVELKPSSSSESIVPLQEVIERHESCCSTLPMLYQVQVDDQVLKCVTVLLEDICNQVYSKVIVQDETENQSTNKENVEEVVPYPSLYYQKPELSVDEDCIKEVLPASQEDVIEYISISQINEFSSPSPTSQKLIQEYEQHITDVPHQREHDFDNFELKLLADIEIDNSTDDGNRFKQLPMVFTLCESKESTAGQDIVKDLLDDICNQIDLKLCVQGITENKKSSRDTVEKFLKCQLPDYNKPETSVDDKCIKEILPVSQEDLIEHRSLSKENSVVNRYSSQPSKKNQEHFQDYSNISDYQSSMECIDKGSLCTQNTGNQTGYEDGEQKCTIQKHQQLVSEVNDRKIKYDQDRPEIDTAFLKETSIANEVSELSCFNKKTKQHQYDKSVCELPSAESSSEVLFKNQKQNDRAADPLSCSVSVNNFHKDTGKYNTIETANIENIAIPTTSDSQFVFENGNATDITTDQNKGKHTELDENTSVFPAEECAGKGSQGTKVLELTDWKAKSSRDTHTASYTFVCRKMNEQGNNNNDAQAHHDADGVEPKETDCGYDEVDKINQICNIYSNCLISPKICQEEEGHSVINCVRVLNEVGYGQVYSELRMADMIGNEDTDVRVSSVEKYASSQFVDCRKSQISSDEKSVICSKDDLPLSQEDVIEFITASQLYSSQCSSQVSQESLSDCNSDRTTTNALPDKEDFPVKTSTSQDGTSGGIFTSNNNRESGCQTDKVLHSEDHRDTDDIQKDQEVQQDVVNRKRKYIQDQILSDDEVVLVKRSHLVSCFHK